MADETILDGQHLKVALAQCPEVGLCRRKNRIDQTPTKMRTLVHIGTYFITVMLLLHFLMMCRYRRLQGRNLEWRVFARIVVLRCVDWFPSQAISLYHHLVWILTLLGRGRAKTIPSYAHGTALGMMNRYWWLLCPSSIWPFCQFGLLQLPVCETPAGKSESFGAAGTSLMDMVVHTPIMLPESLITILLGVG